MKRKFQVTKAVMEEHFNIFSIFVFHQVGRLENAIGWYHSHPGYGCWLSGIDVSTQMLNQNFQEPFVAIVIDPVRTISAGKVCLGSFRTYPKVSRADSVW